MKLSDINVQQKAWVIGCKQFLNNIGYFTSSHGIQVPDVSRSMNRFNFRSTEQSWTMLFGYTKLIIAFSVFVNFVKLETNHIPILIWHSAGETHWRPCSVKCIQHQLVSGESWNSIETNRYVSFIKSQLGNETYIRLVSLGKLDLFKSLSVHPFEQVGIFSTLSEWPNI